MDTRAITVKLLSDFNAQWNDTVPVSGEIFMDSTSQKVKIGDGVTAIQDLPWVDLGINSVKQESNLSRTARMFIENNIELIEANDYDTLYSHIATHALAEEVTRALLKADLNPKPYLSNIPDSIRHILEPEEVWTKDTTTLYTKAEMNAMIDEWNKKLFMQMGIPQNIIKVGN